MFLLFVFIVLISISEGKDCVEKKGNEIILNLTEKLVDTSATLFTSGGCNVERTYEYKGKIDNTVDSLSVIVTDLESSADLNSLSFRGTVLIGEELISLKVVEVHSRSAFPDDLKKEYKMELKELEKKKRIINGKIKELQQVIDIYESMAEGAATDLQHHFENFQKVMSHYLEEKEKFAKPLAEKREEISKIEEEIFFFRSKLYSLSQTTDVVIEIGDLPEIPEDSRFFLTISYSLDNCIWFPSYVLRVDSNEAKGEIEYYANIQQWTGVDWNDVRLFLSDSNIKQNNKPPSIVPLRITLEQQLHKNYYSNVAHSYVGQKTKKESKLEIGYEGFHQDQLMDEEYDMNSGNQKEGMRAKKAEEYSQLFDVKLSDSSSTSSQLSDSTVFQISKKMSIKSLESRVLDGRFNTKTQIVEPFSITADFSHLVLPQQSKDTFVKMKCVHNETFGMLPGIMTVTVDDQFVSKIEIDDPIYTNNGFDLWIGKDNFVEFKKLPIKTDRVTSGLISKYTYETKTVELNVQNNKGIPINVTVVHSLPYPQYGSVQVHLKEPVLIKKSLKELFAKKKIVQDGKNDKLMEEYYDKEGKFVKEFDGQIVRITKENILEHNLVLSPGESKDLVLKYVITMEGVDTNYYVV